MSDENWDWKSYTYTREDVQILSEWIKTNGPFEGLRCFIYDHKKDAPLNEVLDVWLGMAEKASRGIDLIGDFDRIGKESCTEFIIAEKHENT